MPRLRIAFFSPFNPQKTGVSDYSEELLPHLGDKADVDLVAGPQPLTNAALTGRFKVLRAEEFLANRDRYDMAVYQVANSFYQHAYMIPCMQACPGIVVLHDYYLHHLVLGLTLLQGDFPALLGILRPAYGAGARSLAWRLLLSLADPYQVSLTGSLSDMARAVVTHSQVARDLVLADRPAKLVRVIPMGMPAIGTDRRTALRRKHGIAEDEFVLASVSTLSYTKRIEVVLAAVQKLAGRYQGLRLWILGGGRLGDGARRTMASPALAGRVRLTGWTPSETYEELLVAADAVVDLRYPSGAETSASLLRAVAAGKPAIVSAQGSFQELPDSFTRKVRVGPEEQEQLSAAIAEWIANPSTLEAMSCAALEYARTHMRLEQAADAYVDLVREVMEQPAPLSPAGPLRSEAGAGQRLAWGSLYRAFRVGHLVRTYGWPVAIERIRGAAKAGGAV
jgi:glycosyltransferase involved in cell wall biosynthesis